MSIRTFWIMVFRILALYLFLQSFEFLVQLISNVSAVLFGFSNGNEFTSIVIFLLIFSCFLLFVYIILFKTNWLIDKLQLENGIKEPYFDFKISSKTVLKIAIIILGGLLLANNLPGLCKEVVEEIQQKISYKESPNTSWILFYLLKSLFGYLIIYFKNPIVDYVEAKANKDELDIKLEE
jgi:hypothetical protein